MLIKSEENGHYCLVPEFREDTFSLSLLKLMLAVGFLYMPFTKLRKFLSLPILLNVYIMNGAVSSFAFAYHHISNV